MFDSRKQNPNCNYAEEVISYIYDELKSSEKVDFETHLAKCSPCVDEIAAFSSVSLSVKEWRDEEFASIETPQIVIPYEIQKDPATNIQNDIEKASWFDKLQELFNFSPAFLKTATVFGTLALAIGLVWFFAGSLNEKDNTIANGENETQKQKNESIAPKNSEQISSNDAIIAKDEPTFENDDKSEKPQKLVVENTPKTNISIKQTNKLLKVKSSPNIKRKQTVDKNNSKSNSNKKDTNLKPKIQDNNQIQEIPRLTDFALEESEEDDDFRLTDFFDDTESGD